ncbi:MAG: ribosome recycling factor [Parcubacteria group bacterium Greene0714_36]|nr:MAG: ribosome recycling factor [Parcubacteria group bacterium Greene0714_36]
MKDTEQNIEAVIAHLRQEVAGLRTGRASSALVENIEVEYYGTKTPLKALAAITTPGPREIVIQPWDKGAIQPIERAITASALSLAPIADRDVIRLSIPALTEERRRELARTSGKFVEDARIKMRQMRDAMLKEIERALTQKEISENERERRRRDAQKIIDEANKKIEDIAEAKEKEILTV